MLTPAQLALLRAHLRPLKYTLPFALVVGLTGIILLLYLCLSGSVFLLLGMFSCLALLYVAAFLHWLWQDLRFRFLYADRGRVRPRRTRSLGPGILPADIGKYCMYEIFEIGADES